MESFLKYSAEQPSPMSFSQIRVLGGAMARVDRDATAFSHRDAKYMVSFIGMWTEESGDAANRDWAARYWEALKGYSGNRVYSNFLADEGEARVREAYSAATFARLAALKAEFDPENVFSGNQNVAPAREAQAASRANGRTGGWERHGTACPARVGRALHGSPRRRAPIHDSD